jgi:hypothetical protein
MRQVPLKGMKLMVIVASSAVPKLEECIQGSLEELKLRRAG